MLFRRVIIWFLIFVFVAVSLPVFLFYSTSNTLLRESFYGGSIAMSAYDLIVNLTAEKILAGEALLQKNYNRETLAQEIRSVYTLPMFQKVAADFGKQVIRLKENPEKTIVVSMKQYRDSLLTIVNKLAYKIVKEIPVCRQGELPQVNTSGLPTCMANDLSYEQVASPLAAQFEAASYMVPIREQIQVDLNASVGKSGVTIAMVYSSMEKVKTVLYSILLLILVVIGVLSYRKTATLIMYEGTVFLISGTMGYLLSFGLLSLPLWIKEDTQFFLNRTDLLRFINDLISLLAAECQQVSLIFFALGAVLLLISAFIKKNSNEIKYHD